MSPSNVLLPLPLAPVRKTRSPRSIRKLAICRRVALLAHANSSPVMSIAGSDTLPWYAYDRWRGLSFLAAELTERARGVLENSRTAVWTLNETIVEYKLNAGRVIVGAGGWHC